MSRRDPEVHVVVVQSQENGKMGSKVLRRTYASMIKEGGRARGEWCLGLGRGWTGERNSIISIHINPLPCSYVTRGDPGGSTFCSGLDKSEGEMMKESCSILVTDS